MLRKALVRVASPNLECVLGARTHQKNAMVFSNALLLPRSGLLRQRLLSTDATTKELFDVLEGVPEQPKAALSKPPRKQKFVGPQETGKVKVRPIHTAACVYALPRNLFAEAQLHRVFFLQWFDADKGFGFIIREGHPDLFVHYTNIDSTGGVPHVGFAGDMY
jgi:hypothetical protein